METKTPGLCECGCGQKTTIAKQTCAKYGWTRGVPKRFATGHGSRTLPPEKRQADREAKRRAYYIANKEKILARSKAHYWANREKKQLYDKNRRPEIRNAIYIQSQQPRYRYKNYKSGANQRGLPFPITFDQFMAFWQKPCVYCGESIPTIGLDRIDSTLGYTVENLVPCCKWCNVTKMARTPAEFVEHCRAVVRHQDKMGVDCGQGIVGQDRVLQSVQQVPGNS